MVFSLRYLRTSVRWYNLTVRHYTNISGDETYRGPLTGVRVCDLSRVLAGPYCTMILGDMGAEVIKVEKPGFGDDTRHWGPPFLGGESCYFLSINRNKKSIAVDMKQKEGKEIIYELVKKSDVLVENYVYGKLDSLGLGYEKIKDINPAIVYCSINGYGGRGPAKERAGYDIIAASVGGLLNVTGPEDGAPCRVGVAVTDISTGLYAHGAIIAALFERYRTGRGKHINASLLQSQVAMMSQMASNYLNSGKEGKRLGTRHPNIAPYQAVQTKDGHFVIAAANDGQFKTLCKTIGLDSLSSDKRFLTNRCRVENMRVLIDTLEAKFKTEPSSHWMSLLENTSVPCGPINTLKQVFDMPQVHALDLIQEFTHPTAGLVRVPGPAVDYDGESILASAIPPPLLGQHTYDVLSNLLGYSNDKIDSLVKSAAVSVNNTKT